MQTETITTKKQGRGKTQDLTPATLLSIAECCEAIDWNTLSIEDDSAFIFFSLSVAFGNFIIHRYISLI
jgi:hypothetical protein